MIDEDLLRQLGWSEDLIMEVVRTADSLGAPLTAPGGDPISTSDVRVMDLPADTTVAVFARPPDYKVRRERAPRAAR